MNGSLIVGLRRHADLSGARFMEVERSDIYALLDYVEKLETVASLASSYAHDDPRFALDQALKNLRAVE